MLLKVRITDPGDTDFFWEIQVDRYAFMDANETISGKGGMPAEGEPILWGLLKHLLKQTALSLQLHFKKQPEF